MSDQTIPVSVAYLGPQGTYGHQAAKRFITELKLGSATTVPCPTIREVYINPSEYLVLPLQNVIHGSVTETVDSLLSPLSPPTSTSSYAEEAEAGPSRSRNGGYLSRERPEIIADLDLPIRHSLVVRKGVKMEDIRWVRSHEQALGQSSIFLQTHLPRAKLQAWPSTAGAALSLLPKPPQTRSTQPDDGGSDNRELNGGDHTELASGGEEEEIGEDIGEGAAICSASAVLDHTELEVLYEGTQSISNNFTRFLLLSRRSSSSSSTSPSHHPSSSSPNSIPYIQPSPIEQKYPPHRQSHFYALSHPPHLSLFPPKALSRIIGIHTRPYPVHPPSCRQQPSTTRIQDVRKSISEDTGVGINGVQEGYEGDLGGKTGEGMYRTMTLLEISAASEGDKSLDGNLGLKSDIGTGVKGDQGMIYLGTAKHLP